MKSAPPNRSESEKKNGEAPSWREPPFSLGKIRLRDSLHIKLFVPVFIGLVVLIVIQAQVLVNLNRTQYLGAMETRLHHASADLHRCMVEVMVFGDHRAENVESDFAEALALAKIPESGFVARLLDARGKRLAGAIEGNPAFEDLGPFSPRPSLDHVELRGNLGLGMAMPIINRTSCRRCHGEDGESLGWVLLAASQDELRAGENIIKRSGLIIVLVLSLVFGLTVWALMFIHISRPLAELQTLMGRVMRGDLKARHQVEGRDELAQLGRRFNMMVARLEEIDQELQEASDQLMIRAEKMVNVGEMASRLAHEIRNPLAGIESVVSIFIEDLPEDDPERPILLETLEQIHRIEHTISDLLALARPKPVQFATVQVGDVLSGLVVFCRTGKIAGQHTIELTVPDHLPPIQADRDRLKQAFLNVLMNAFQVMEEPGRVTITAGIRDVVARGREVWVTISDTGPGIPAESLHSIFNPFFTTRMRGTGLGLAITRSIVNQHLGDLRVKQTGPEGTTFIFSFPIDPSALGKD